MLKFLSNLVFKGTFWYLRTLGLFLILFAVVKWAAYNL